ncbi:MAG: hypothetical protein V9E90_14035 [Saprospiraceae bacterium]|jgi:hypothetical protein
MSFESKKAFKITLALEILTFLAILVNIYIQIRQQYNYRFFESKLQTYVELVSTTGQLVSENSDLKRFNDLQRQFYSIYYGKSQLFEGKDMAVKKSIMEFKAKLEKISMNENGIIMDTEYNNLKIAALHLANSCSEELER